MFSDDRNRWIISFVMILMISIPAVLLLGFGGREMVGDWNGLKNASPFLRLLFSAVTL